MTQGQRLDTASRSQTVADLLHVEAGEGRPLLLLWAHSFFAGVAVVPLLAAGNALFLSQFSSDWLPHAYIASAGMSISAAWIYNRARRRLTTARLFRGLLFGLLACVLALRLGFRLTEASWPAFVLLGFSAVTNSLLNVEVWGVAGQLFTVRQGKRLFGLVGSGELMAMVLGGLATPLLVAWFGTENLLLVAAAGLGGCLLCLAIIEREQAGRLSRRAGGDAESGHTGIFALARNRYTLWVFLLAVVGVSATRLVDYAFLDQAHTRYHDEDELARLFGLFFGIANAVTLVVLTFITGPLLNRFGIATGMLLRRMALTACIVVTALVLFAFPSAEAVYWLALAAMMADLVLLSAISAPAFLILYQPLRPDRRLATQLAVESVIGPLASAAAAGSILLVNALGLGGPRAVALLTLAVLVCWRFVGRRTNQGYREALPEALEHRRLEGVSIPLEEGDMLEVLRQRLQSPRPHEVLYALDLLTSQSTVTPADLLGPLLEHPHPQVRLDVMQRIARDHLVELTDAVRNRLDVEEDPRTLAETLRCLAELEEAEAVDVLGVFLDHPDGPVAEAATVGLLRSGGIDGILIAGERLLSLERSQEAGERERAARILGNVGIRGFYRHLLDLLWDPDISVRRAALAAAGKLRNPRLWPAVIDNLAHVEFHTSAAQALIDAGAETIPALGEALGNPDAEVAFRIRVAEACGRIGGAEAIALLKVRMDTEDRRLRTAILHALDRADYRAVAGDRGNIDDILWQELGDAAWIMAAIVDVGIDGGDATDPLRRALEHRLRQIRGRCLQLLGFTGDAETLKRAAEQLDSDVADQRAYALEVLDTALSGDTRRYLMTLFEGVPATVALQQMSTSFPQRLLGRNQRLSLLITPGGHRFEPWIRACSVRAAILLGEVDLAADVAQRLDDDSRLVSETAAWALRTLSPSLWSEQEERITEQGLVPPDLMFWIESWKPGERPMFLTVEKVMVLRSVGVFADVPEEVLADLAGYLEEIEVGADERVYEKGAVGRTMYIIAEGRVHVHDEEHSFTELHTGEVFGELTTLDPEPHSASVTALADTRLLGLDRDALYELMSAHPTVLRGLIHILCRRLRAKGRRN
ncbi:MAG TPA: cyclic nucleotide-binding domain-containing protein [Candidatus Latescibacteria bacterium]|nr:hypothetical protein [Gemmatimonadaceae bacterium]HJP32984.1 cyclic nucleotide-binding domain-containing protein [Candidatus Latescibacterota bacterium]